MSDQQSDTFVEESFEYEGFLYYFMVRRYPRSLAVRDSYNEKMLAHLATGKIRSEASVFLHAIEELKESPCDYKMRIDKL